MKQTPNYNLPQFDGTDYFNKEALNDAFSKIDVGISDIQDSINVLEPTAVKYVKDLKIGITKSEELILKNEQLVANGGLVTQVEKREIVSSLEHIVQQRKKTLIYFDEFGGVPNDTNFDNTPILLQCIEYIKTTMKGGTIVFGAGIYTFKTNIVITHLRGINFLGSVIGHNFSDYNGTFLNYTGVGYMIEVKNQFLDVTFSQLGFQGNVDNSLIVLGSEKTNTGVNTHFKSCSFQNWMRVFKAIRCGYTRFNDCRFGSSTTHYMIELGADVNENNSCEYFWFTRCTFEGLNAGSGSGAIQIQGAVFVYFDKCDFCNWTLSPSVKILSPFSQTYNSEIYFTECSFANNKFGVYMLPNNQSINNITFKDNTWILLGDTVEEYFIRIDSVNSAYQVNNIIIDDYFKSRNLVEPSFGFYFNKVQALDLNMRGRKYNQKLTSVSKWKIKSLIIDKNYILNLQPTVGQTVFEYIITNQSPFNFRPYYHLTFNKKINEDYTTSISNTFNGELKLTITFSTQPSVTQSNIYFTLLDTGIIQ